MFTKKGIIDNAINIDNSGDINKQKVSKNGNINSPWTNINNFYIITIINS